MINEVSSVPWSASEHDGGSFPPTVFLTGATGFLGGQLLVRLLDDADRRVFCLVRAESAAHAKRRGDERMGALLGEAKAREARNRVEWVCGDLHRPGLGLGHAEAAELAEAVEEIVHCAADVNFDTPFVEAHRTNVVGVQYVHDFALRCAASGLRRLHHVSTAYAAGRQSGVVTAGFLPPDDPRFFRNDYERTKAMAERVLMTESLVPVTVYRPSIIVGDSHDGWTESFNVLYEPMRRIAAGQMPIAPIGGRGLLDTVPVDYVADAILALASRDDTAGGTFHITAGRETLTVAEFLEQTYRGMARRSGGPATVRTRTLGPTSWRAVKCAARGLAHLPSSAGRVGTYARVARRMFDSVEVFEEYGRVSTEFDDRRERALLADADIALDPVQQWFPRVVDHALAADFGRGARTRPAEPARSQVTRPRRGRDLAYQAGLVGFVRPSNATRMSRYLSTVDPHRLGRLGYLVGSGLVAAPLRYAEQHRFGQLFRSTDVRSPIFVIGHWRSGTTHLHNLLTTDHRFGYLSMYQAMTPDFSIEAEGWLRPMLARITPERRPMDNMTWPLDAPQEEEIPLAKTCGYSFYLQFLFPRASEELFERYVLFKGHGWDRLAARWDRSYRDLLSVATLRSGHRRLILKNPVNTARVSRLLELYPDARFVHIHRDPYEVFVSTLNLHREVLRFTSLNHYDEELIRHNVLRLYELTMERYLQDRALVPDGQLTDVRYDDLVRDPAGELGRVYDELGIPAFEVVRPAVDRYVDSQRDYVRNSFTIEERDIADVSQRWSFAFEELGWPIRTPEASVVRVA